MAQITEEARQLARAVLEPEADLTAVCALIDCLLDQLDNPDFRYSPEWVHRLELTLRVWWSRLMEKGKWNGSFTLSTESLSGYFIPAHVYLSILQDYQSLRNDCKEIFDREVVRDS